MQQFCPWEPAQYFIFSSNVPNILYYALIPGMVLSVIFSIFVISKNKNTSSKLLFLISFLFFLWGIGALILFATNRPDAVMFFWSLTILVEPFIYVLSFYLAYSFITKKDIPFKGKMILLAVFLPFLVFLNTKYNLIGVNLSDCTAIEGVIAKYYSYIVEFLIALSIIIFSILKYRKEKDLIHKKEIMYFSIGIIIFLFGFSSGNIVGSFNNDWIASQYGYFGMPIFIGFLGYMIVKYKTFNIKLIATQALVWALAILIGAQFLFIKVKLNYFLTGITFIGAVAFGQLLIRSVKREVEQKEELAKLNINLRNVIQQRESLMHLINHKVKGSFTHSKYIFAGLLDGMFGDISSDVKKIAQAGLDSDVVGIRTIDMILNATNLQNGTVSYDMKPVDFKEIVLNVVEERKSVIQKKNLELEMKIKEGGYQMNGDIFWLKEVVNNLVDNAINYTKAGKIIVGLEKQDKKIIFSVKDSGIGITPEDKKNLFTEGGRGKESVKTNVESTGYGLYTVKLVTEAHGGKVWVESEGEGKGSEFFAQFDAI